MLLLLLSSPLSERRAGRADTCCCCCSAGLCPAVLCCCCKHCVLLQQVMSVVGILQDETDPMVSVMKVRVCLCVHACMLPPAVLHPRQAACCHRISAPFKHVGHRLPCSLSAGCCWMRCGRSATHDAPLPLLCPWHATPQVEKAPLESYADVGGLEQQVQEIKEAVELPLTHPELYEDIGIKPPKV